MRWEASYVEFLLVANWKLVGPAKIVGCAYIQKRIQGFTEVDAISNEFIVSKFEILGWKKI